MSINASQRLAKNQEATETFVRQEFPNEKFVSQTSKLQAANKWTETLVLPKNVKLAESRIPINKEQRNILKKELLQASILSKMGNSIYLTPEKGEYRKRTIDAVVNGLPYEFRTIFGNAKTLEWEFARAKEKGKDVNVFIRIESLITKYEVRRRIGMVLERHPDYTGKIIVSFKGGRTYFWDTKGFRIE